MNETLVGRRSLSGEAPRRYVFNESLFRARAAALGAKTDRERCAVAGISRASLNRWRRGVGVPSLPVLDRVAERLGVDRASLIREVR